MFLCVKALVGMLVHSAHCMVCYLLAQECTTCNHITSKALSELVCPHLLHFDGPEFKLGVSVTPQCRHREVPAWLEGLVQFSGPVLLTLSLQWAGQVGGEGGGWEIRAYVDTDMTCVIDKRFKDSFEHKTHSIG